jgi:hypothetical protein
MFIDSIPGKPLIVFISLCKGGTLVGLLVWGFKGSSPPLASPSSKFQDLVRAIPCGTTRPYVYRHDSRETFDFLYFVSVKGGTLIGPLVGDSLEAERFEQRPPPARLSTKGDNPHVVSFHTIPEQHCCFFYLRSRKPDGFISVT